MLMAYEQKYGTNVHMAAKALRYHQDIDDSGAIKLLPMAYDFDKIAKTLETMAKRPNDLVLRYETCV